MVGGSTPPWVVLAAIFAWLLPLLVHTVNAFTRRRKSSKQRTVRKEHQMNHVWNLIVGVISTLGANVLSAALAAQT